MINDKNILEGPLFLGFKKSTLELFWEFHTLNPQMYHLFLKFARQLKGSGRKKYGVCTIGQRIRWHVAVETKGDNFKINNNHMACYGRLLAVVHPEEFGDFFEFRFPQGTFQKEQRQEVSINDF